MSHLGTGPAEGLPMRRILGRANTTVSTTANIFSFLFIFFSFSLVVLQVMQPLLGTIAWKAKFNQCGSYEKEYSHVRLLCVRDVIGQRNVG